MNTKPQGKNHTKGKTAQQSHQNHLLPSGLSLSLKYMPTATVISDHLVKIPSKFSAPLCASAPDACPARGAVQKWGALRLSAPSAVPPQNNPTKQALKILRALCEP
jgi:hypothetical protein